MSEVKLTCGKPTAAKLAKEPLDPVFSQHKHKLHQSALCSDAVVERFAVFMFGVGSQRVASLDPTTWFPCQRRIAAWVVPCDLAKTSRQQRPRKLMCLASGSIIYPGNGLRRLNVLASQKARTKVLCNTLHKRTAIRVTKGVRGVSRRHAQRKQFIPGNTDAQPATRPDIESQ